MLEPTLTAAPPAEALYSVRANFFVAFFGGVYAAIVFCGLNAHRMRRLAGDAWILAAVGLGWSGFLMWTGHASTTGNNPEWLGAMGAPGRTVRLVGRGISLGLFGLMFLRWRATYRTQWLAGTAAPNPWSAGLTALAVSMAASFLFFMLGALLARG